MTTVGSYIVGDLIGEGSFGRTYRAQHALLGLPACIKEEATGESKCQQLFREEAETLWKLGGHAGIAGIKDYIEQRVDGSLYQYIILDFISGITLENFVLSNGFIDDEHIAWILDRILRALAYAHWKLAIHSDIKPANLMLQLEAHNVVILDFGLAVMGGRPGKAAKGGSEIFHAPEVLSNDPPLPESDIYSTGVVALYLAGGDKAATSLSPPADMDRELAEIIQHMTRRDVTRRPRSTLQIAYEIGQWRLHRYKRGETKELLKLRNGRVITDSGDVK